MPYRRTVAIAAPPWFGMEDDVVGRRRRRPHDRTGPAAHPPLCFRRHRSRRFLTRSVNGTAPIQVGFFCTTGAEFIIAAVPRWPVLEVDGTLSHLHARRCILRTP